MLYYFKILLKQRLAAWNPFVSNSNKKGKDKARIVSIGLAMIILYGMLVALEYFMFSAFNSIGDTKTMLGLVGVMCTVTTLFLSFFYITSTLFFSKDVSYISALPISSRGVFSAKLLSVFLEEAVISLFVCLPTIILYGISSSLNVFYYINAIVLTFCIPMVPVAFIALVAFILIKFSALWKRREALTVIISIIFFGAIMWAEMSISMSSSGESFGAGINQMVANNSSLLSSVSKMYPPINWYVAALSNDFSSSIVNWMMFIGVNIGSIALVIYCVGGIYQKLAVKQTEAITKLNAKAKRKNSTYVQNSPLLALYKREVKEIFKVPSYAMNCLVSGIIFPIIIVVMSLSSNNTQDMPDLITLVQMLPNGLFIAIVTAMFLFVNSINMASATAVSREGSRHEFFRMMPVEPQTHILAKLLMGCTIGILTSIPLLIAIMILIPGFVMELLIAFIASLLFLIAFSTFALIIDINHPKFDWKTETEAIKQNGIAAMSMFGCMLLVVVCGFGYYGLCRLNLSYSLSFIVICFLTLVIDILLSKHLFSKGAIVYSEQEV